MIKKLILIFTTMTLVGSISFCTFLFLGKNKQNPKNNVDDSTNEIATEKSDNTKQDETIVLEKENIKEKVDDTITTQKQTTSKESKQEKTSPAVTTQTNTKTQQEVNQTPVVQETNKNSVTETPSVAPTQVETIQTPAPTPSATEKTYTENWVRNDAMIETIRQAIINNESEPMKTYGYTIVVDSSIKSLTNPFTFTEKRLNRLLSTACGTIKIYAEDYYVNGEYIMTDSYVL